MATASKIEPKPAEQIMLVLSYGEASFLRGMLKSASLVTMIDEAVGPLGMIYSALGSAGVTPAQVFK